MVLLYNLAIFFYSIFIRIASIFNQKAKLFISGRQNWESDLAKNVVAGEKYNWFHCSSLGEFEQCRPVIEELKLKRPKCKILLTFFSPSGYEIRKNYTEADIVCYLPIDTRRNARKFLEIANPIQAIFVKYEFWYHFINEINKKEIPLYIISAIFRDNQVFFRSLPWGKWFRGILNNISHFFIQNEKSGELLTSIGLTNYTIAGDTRFDRVAKIAESSKEIPIVEKFKNSRVLVAVGSSWKADEELLIQYINQNESTKFVIAPHEVSEANISRIEQALVNPVVRFSKASEKNLIDTQVLIIDSIGILSSIYRYAEIAYIGGGFGVGIHNILEAATFGMPVVFGPNYKKFDEACRLIEIEGAFSVDNFETLKSIFDSLLGSKAKREKAKQTTKNFVKMSTGATSIITKKVFNI